MDDFGVSLGRFWRMKVTLGQLGAYFGFTFGD